MKLGTIVTPILQMRNLRLNEVKLLTYPRSDMINVGFQPRSSAHMLSLEVNWQKEE